MTFEKDLGKTQAETSDHQILSVELPVRIFPLNKRKEAVMYALETRGHLYIWGTDGHSDWLKKGDQTDYPYCLVVIESQAGFPDYLSIAPVTTGYVPSELDTPQITVEILETLYRESKEEVEREGEDFEQTGSDS